MVSDVVIRDPIGTLVRTIERLAQEGSLPSWCVVDLFPYLTTLHWRAYAREAGVPFSQEIIRAAQTAFKEHVQYWGSSETLAKEANTMPAIKSLG